MKKTLGMLIGFMTIACTTSAFAQQSADAKNILNQVSKKYDSYQTIEASFTFSTIQRNNSTPYTETGTLYLDNKNNRYHITMKTQELISDAKNLYTILKEEKEVQIAEVENNEEAINPSNIFNFYKTGFNYKSLANEKAAATVLNVIELKPTDAKRNFSKIKLRINSSTKLIHDATIFDKNGGQYSYSIKNLTPNKNLSSSLFTFNKSNYSNYEIVDLR